MYTRDKPLRVASRKTRNQAMVLDVLHAAGGAMTAYEILDKLRDRGLRAPAQIYRALDGLLGREEVHRIESLNAYVACNHRDHGDLGAFAICDDCRTIWEFTLPAEAGITAVAESKGFTTHEVMVELHGSCARCKEARKII